MVMKNVIYIGGTTFSRPRMGTTNVWSGLPDTAFKGKKTMVVNANSKKATAVKSVNKKSSKKGKK